MSCYITYIYLYQLICLRAHHPQVTLKLLHFQALPRILAAAEIEADVPIVLHGRSWGS